MTPPERVKYWKTLENSVFVKPAYLHVVIFAMCVIKLRSEDLSHNDSKEGSKLYTLYGGKTWLKCTCVKKYISFDLIPSFEIYSALLDTLLDAKWHAVISNR